ncbi:hypothetical protein CAPTEDRAFT_223958 [Capitella teleta]|uniref:VWFD domain-containing protein n=1 Tax=Capitella teleta TaxID=283909 RepID=R7USB1_CAPTE|nr:hypothetical protein CAPTEDRAFT_223958 [Capitella teleta]|eukprot:ELU09404.1 hypothetical protein CAPTEDRAFT_223958 [Capitella teleta]
MMPAASCVFSLLVIAFCLQVRGERDVSFIIRSPDHRLEYEVYYRAEQDQAPMKECAEYYARSFLEIFIAQHSANGLQGKLHSRCTNRSSEVNVLIHPVAVVRMKGHQVTIQTFVDVSMTNDELPFDEGPYTTCADTVNKTLTNLVEFENSAAQRMLTIPSGSDQCSAATMDPQYFIYRKSDWICPTNYSLTHGQNICSREVECCDDTSVPPDPGTGSDTTDDSSDNSVHSSVTMSPDVTQPAQSFRDQEAWDIEAFKVSPMASIRLTEGISATDLPIKVWANHSFICQNQPGSCHISVDVRIMPFGENPSQCRRTGANIAQVVLDQNVRGLTPNGECRFLLPSDHSPGKQTLPLKAVMDNKYDGQQLSRLHLSLTRTVVDDAGRSTVYQENIHSFKIVVDDRDRKATCQSINDPHISSFDGLEFNNFYEGEFLLYEHLTLPFKVHAIYQRCTMAVDASCNCAVAVQSGDDVIVIDRCYRQKQPIKRISGTSQPFTKMALQLYLNGELTPGTRVHQSAEGQKFSIYLPNGVLVKVMINNLLINVWITPSPSDLEATRGLCGFYDGIKTNDLRLKNGTLMETSLSAERTHPDDFLLSWRVDMSSDESAFQGVPESVEPILAKQFCSCDESTSLQCGYSLDVNFCDNIVGDDITEELVLSATPSIFSSSRKKRDISENNVFKGGIDSDPIVVDTKFKPPITGNTTWADSARDAMKAQCLEEVQRNPSLPKDLADKIANAMCLNDCSGHGQCISGSCVCEAGYSTVDCSVSERSPPYVHELPNYGLCDVSVMNCNTVLVWGRHFANSPNLVCHLTEVEVDEVSYRRLSKTVTVKAIYLNFNAVKCTVPTIRSYLISISNNQETYSDPLLFIPFDPACNQCYMTNTTCIKKKNSCIINGKCYHEGEVSLVDSCLICKAYENEYQWTSRGAAYCEHPWWDRVQMPDWAVALLAALGGSLIGVLAGFLLYKCCCKSRRKTNQSSGVHLDHGAEVASPFQDAILHRNQDIPEFHPDHFPDIDDISPSMDYDETYFYNDGKGVENGVDSTTYF